MLSTPAASQWKGKGRSKDSDYLSPAVRAGDRPGLNWGTGIEHGNQNIREKA